MVFATTYATIEPTRAEIDASGRPLGRSFVVRSWPTLVFLRDGIEVSRLVRPAGVAPIARELERIDEPSAGP